MTDRREDPEGYLAERNERLRVILRNGIEMLWGSLMALEDPKYSYANDAALAATVEMGMLRVTQVHTLMQGELVLNQLAGSLSNLTQQLVNQLWASVAAEAEKIIKQSGG